MGGAGLRGPAPPSRQRSDPPGLNGLVPSPAAVADALARAHHQPPDGLPDGPHLVDYAESSRVGDWSLRSALVRFAQPEPTRAGAVLELIRRTDGALKPHRRLLESTAVPTHPSLGSDVLSVVGETVSVAADAARVLDARAADLARATLRLPDGEAVVAAYAAAEGVPQPELDAAVLLVVALDLDVIADALTAWADVHDGPPPIDVVDAQAATAFGRLTSLGVPRETAPAGGRPPGRRRS